MFGSQGYLPQDVLPPSNLMPLAKDTTAPTLATNSKQFSLLALTASEDNYGSSGIKLVDPYEIEPSSSGNDEKPDVLLRVQQLAFHPGSSLLTEEFSSVTLRLDVGQDSLVEDVTDPIFWAIAAGLDLHDAVSGTSKAQGVRSPDYRADYSKGLRRSKVVVPGGLGLLRFELEAHRPDPNWKKLWKFATSRAGQSMAAVLGFPMVAPEALAIIDEAFNRFTDGSETLMASSPVRFALNKQGKEQFTCGLPIDIPSLNPGLYILASREHQDQLLSASKLAAGHGTLLNEATSVSDFVAKGHDPFAELTYAVIRIDSKPVARADD